MEVENTSAYYDTATNNLVLLALNFFRQWSY